MTTASPFSGSPVKLKAVTHFVAPAQYGRGDATYVSEDDVVYILHRKQLARRSDAFSDAQDFGGGDGEPCQLAETAAVLDALLPYLYGIGLPSDLLRLKPELAIECVRTYSRF